MKHGHQFPIADIDSNETRRLEDGSLEAQTLIKYASRGFQIGELVLLVDVGDGPEEPFVTWGRVTSRGKVVKFKLVGEAIGNGITGGYLYVKKDTVAEGFGARVIETGGGQVHLLVDRDTASYPPDGERVRVVVE